MEKSKEIDLIKMALASMRPYLQQDGGDIDYVELRDDNVLVVKFSDSCNGCKFKEQTKFIIEKQIRKIFPELKEMIEISE